jgi:hypothetical protein
MTSFVPRGDFFPPKGGSTTPQEQPGELWHAPDHLYREKCAKESRRMLSHGVAGCKREFFLAERPTPEDARSIARTPRNRSFHWRDGAWPASWNCQCKSAGSLTVVLNVALELIRPGYSSLASATKMQTPAGA